MRKYYIRIEKIEGFVNEIDAHEFAGNELVKDACHANLIIISEAMTRMSDETKLNYPSLNWREIVGFRNLLVHEYFRINWITVWEVITQDLKILEESATEILNR